MQNNESFPGFKTPEEEVEFLRSYIKEREGALPQAEKSPTSLAETTKAVVQEYAATPTEEVLAPSAVVPAHESDAIVLRLVPETHDKKIEELFGMIWVFGTAGKIFPYQSGVLMVGYSYGYFDGRDLLKVGFLLAVLESAILFLLVPLYWPLIGLL